MFDIKLFFLRFQSILIQKLYTEFQNIYLHVLGNELKGAPLSENMLSISNI